MIESVLFDLDGTLLDTAPDLVYALNQLRLKYALEELPFEQVRSQVGYGSKTLLKLAFEVEEAQYKTLADEFLKIYQLHLLKSTKLFPKMEEVLHHLDKKNIPWGIVTNRPTRFTGVLLDALNLSQRTDCVICGDSLPKQKPDPYPIMHACSLIKADVKKCLYVGDMKTDVLASKAAGAKSLVALYGYIGNEDNPYSWEADGYIEKPIEILDWL